MAFKSVNQRQSFPDLEKEILQFWRENDTFRKSIENRKDAKEFTFYDGPPFATGLPHYGHILAGTIKDVIPRYQTMRGYRVERRFGWDCHGLPVENLIEKELGLSDRDALVEYGIDKFNEGCRASVLRYASEWEEVVERMGRWVDFKNDYKTMDPEFMESVWWVFDQLWEKGLVYEGHKPMHICPRCVTALSNFEVNLGYKDITDQSVTAKFKVDGEENTYILAWTTTPWTLAGNLALAVHPDVEYVKVKVLDHALRVNTGELKYINVILAKDIYNKLDEESEKVEKSTFATAFGLGQAHGIKGGETSINQSRDVLQEFKGSELVKKYPTYEPLFDSFTDKKAEGAFKVVEADFVTTDSGTGIVHIAPAFGEDDLKVGKENDLPWVQHIGMDGKLIPELAKEFENKKVKNNKLDNEPDALDLEVVEKLKAQGSVFETKRYRHSYPHCWRCDTPLLNYATSSWFVKVEQIKQMLIDNNQKVHWVPEHLKDGRFGKWLEGARDWAISRTRYWGTPLPIWRCDNVECKHTESVGSIEKLEKKTGEKVTDIHKHFVDDLTWDCPECSGKMKRIEEVFDCWFESGSMPYAQKHYPFAYNRKLKNTYYVLRHGEGEHNVNNLISCDPEFGCHNTNLTEKGKESVGKNVKMFKDIKVDVIYSSDFLRTKQTAEILNEVAQTEVVFDERLREFNVGEFQGKNIHEYESAFPKKEEKWTKAASGGETYSQIEERMAEAFNEYESKHEGKTIVIVSHGDPLKILLGYLNAEFKKITAYAHCPIVGVPQKIELKTEADFQAQYPADFIAEGLDQTRGWFYTLHVLGSALFEKPAFQNVITNGIVLAEDGQKMSKSKQNYPDPNLVFESYGADAMRFYLMNSPVVKADDMRFTEHGVNEVVKGMILPLWNSYAFFVTYANIDGWTPSQTPLRGQGGVSSDEVGDSIQARKTKSNKLDQWILSALNELLATVTDEMENYDLQKAASPIFGFIDNLTNWYIRRSRRRFWKSENDTDKDEAYATLYEVLVKTSQIIAPFMPFVSEEIYQNLTRYPEGSVAESKDLVLPENDTNKADIAQESNRENNQVQVGDVKTTVSINSVHLTDWPEVDKNFLNEKLNAEMSAIQQIVKLGLAARAKAKIKVRQPLPKIQLALSDKYDLKAIQTEFEVIQEELNIKEIEIIQNAEEIAQVMASPNARLLGPKYGKEVQNIIREAKSGNFEKLENGNYKILDFEVLSEEIEIVYQGKEGFNVEADQGIVVALDTQITKELKQEGTARELVRYIQDMRKEADFNVEDRIDLFIQTESSELQQVLTDYKNYIINETLAQELKLEKGEKVDLEKEFELENEKVVIGVNVIL